MPPSRSSRRWRRVAPPEWASRSLYLAGILLEDRDETARAMAHYERVASFEQFPERAAEALWRAGWWAYRNRNYAPARERFVQVAERLDRSALAAAAPALLGRAHRPRRSASGQQAQAELHASPPSIR